MESQQVLFNYKNGIKAVVVLLLVIPIVSYSHELGHVFVCEFYGNESEVHLGLSFVTLCFGSMNEAEIFALRQMGGYVGAGVAVALLLIANKLFRRAWINAPIFVLSVLQFTEMILESFANEFYMEHGSLITAPFLLAGLILALVHFERRM